MFIFSKGFLYTATPLVALSAVSVYSFGIPGAFSVLSKIKELKEPVDVYGQQGVYDDPEFTVYLESYVRRLLEKHPTSSPRSFRTAFIPIFSMMPELIEGSDSAYIVWKDGKKIPVPVSVLFEAFIKVLKASSCNVSDVSPNSEERIKFIKKYIESRGFCVSAV